MADIVVSVGSSPVINTMNGDEYQIYKILENIEAQLSTKVDKVVGKGLSSNDYTTEEKTKLSELPSKTELDTDLSGKEDTANKTLVLDSNSTHHQYPSAKCVYDADNALVLADERAKYYGDKDIIPSDESYFTVNSTGETITGLTDTGKTQTELVIPYKINGVKITDLEYGDNTSILNGNGVITKIVIPNSVTRIGDDAFKDCTSLMSVNIPNSVTNIGFHAFFNCTSLTSINIPSSVTSIEIGVFVGCTSLKSVTIPNSVTSIGYYAFENCSSLTSVNIPSSVTSIGVGAFDGCTNLTIYCEQGSYAETYARTNNIPIVYTAINNVASGKVTTITVPTTGWTTSTDTNGTTYYSINITDSTLTSTGYPISDVVLPSDIAAARLQSEAYQNVNKITVNDGSVDLYCFDSLPTVSFQIRIQILYM